MSIIGYRHENVMMQLKRWRIWRKAGLISDHEAKDWTPVNDTESKTDIKRCPRCGQTMR